MAKTTPVACILTLADLTARAERWHRLTARAMTERAETPDGLHVCFRPEAEEELRALVAAETECCPWVTWTVERQHGGRDLIRELGVRVVPGAVDHHRVGRARRASRPRCRLLG